MYSYNIISTAAPKPPDILNTQNVCVCVCVCVCVVWNEATYAVYEQFLWEQQHNTRFHGSAGSLE